MKFKEEIDREIPKDDSTSEAEKTILYWLIRDFKPRTVIETGTHRGYTSLYMAHALYDNNYGHLTTCDPNTEWGQKGNFSKFPELSPFITYKPIRGDKLDVGQVDFAFIDGFHSKQDVIEELEMLLPRLSEMAIVVFHDCWYGNTDGVNEALEESGLHTVWIPTKNAMRIYVKHPDRPRSI